MFAGKKSAQIREILISESAWEEMTCLFAPSLAKLDIKIFDSASGEWSDFVTQGRQGTLSHNFDAVSGPMVANPGTVRRGDTPKPIGSQLAIFSDKAAALFDRFNTRGC